MKENRDGESEIWTGTERICEYLQLFTELALHLVRKYADPPTGYSSFQRDVVRWRIGPIVLDASTISLRDCRAGRSCRADTIGPAGTMPR
jgi:hypothetical protein